MKTFLETSLSHFEKKCAGDIVCICIINMIISAHIIILLNVRSNHETLFPLDIHALGTYVFVIICIHKVMTIYLQMENNG